MMMMTKFWTESSEHYTRVKTLAVSEKSSQKKYFHWHQTVIPRIITDCIATRHS